MKKNMIVMKYSLLAGIAVTSLVSVNVSAQTVNYGEMEMLFGEPVTTSATGKPQRVSDVALNMEIITAEDIMRSGSSDIPEILRRVAGVSVQRSNFGTTNVGIRGYNSAFSERVLVLVNGRQVYLDHFGYVEWASIPVALEEIRQIEIVKGPNTALFGFNAVSGVINIVTYDPLDDDKSAATIRYGTGEYREVNAVASVKLSDKLGLRISAGGYDSNEFDNEKISPPEEAIIKDETDRHFVAVNVAYQIAENVRLNAEYTRSDSSVNGFPILRALSRSDYSNESFKAGIATETSFGLTDFSIYHNTLDNLDVLIIAEFPIDQKVTDVKLNHLLKLNNKHAIRITFGYRNNEWHSQLDTPNVNFAYKILTIGGLWDWTINNKAAFSIAARLDNVNPGLFGDLAKSRTNPDDFRDTFNEISINAGLIYKFTDNDTLRLTYARGVDLPSLIETSINVALGNGATNTGLIELKSSIVDNYEIGYERQLSDNVNLSLSAYYQDIRDLQGPPDLVTPVFVNGVPTVPFQIIGDSSIFGVEVVLDGTIGDNLKWDVNYSYTDLKDDLTVNKVGTTTPVDFEENNAAHILNANIQYSWNRFEVDLNGSLTSKREQIRFSFLDPSVPFVFVRLPTRFILNARIGYNINDTFSIAFEGQGLTQQHYAETSLAKIERRVRVSLQAAF